MSRYAKKPVVIEAIQWTGENQKEIYDFAKEAGVFTEGNLFLETLEGMMKASVGDYIIKGVKGKVYACKSDIFEMTYANENEIGNFSDGFHTYNELYDFRKMYNAALFNEWAKERVQHPHWWKEGRPYYSYKYDVHKSWKHFDGELCFGGGWFIVTATLPTGQISNHYKAEDWDLFQVPEEPKAKYEFDGHTGKDVLERLKSLTK